MSETWKTPYDPMGEERYARIWGMAEVPLNYPSVGPSGPLLDLIMVRNEAIIDLHREFDRLRAEAEALRRLAGAREQALLKADEMRDMLESEPPWIATHALEKAILVSEYEGLVEVADECAKALS